MLLCTVAPFMLALGGFGVHLLMTAEAGIGIALIGSGVSVMLSLAMIAVSAYALVELIRDVTAAAAATPRSTPGAPAA